MLKTLGAKLKFHRKRKGYSLRKLAKITSSGSSYIWALENNDSLKPSAEKLCKIATALDITVEYLFSKSESFLWNDILLTKFNRLTERDQLRADKIISDWGNENA